jgi:hypothetical protein
MAAVVARRELSLLGLNSRRLSSRRHEDKERRWESKMPNGDNNSGM